MPQQEAIAATVPVVEAFVRLGVRYYVGGSLARTWPLNSTLGVLGSGRD